MVVGVGRLRLALPGNSSLKGKRKVVRGVVTRVRSRFNVAVAEVDDMDVHESAVLGFVAVGNDHRHVNSTLDKVMDFVEELGLAPVEERGLEMIHC